MLPATSQKGAAAVLTKISVQQLVICKRLLAPSKREFAPGWKACVLESFSKQSTSERNHYDEIEIVFTAVATEPCRELHDSSARANPQSCARGFFRHVAIDGSWRVQRRALPSGRDIPLLSLHVRQ